MAVFDDSKPSSPPRPASTPFWSWIYKFWTWVTTFLQDPDNVNITGGTLTDVTISGNGSIGITNNISVTGSNSIQAPTIVSDTFLLNAIVRLFSSSAWREVTATNGGTTDYTNDMAWTVTVLKNTGIATHTVTLGGGSIGQIIIICATGAIAALTINGASGVTIENFNATDFASNNRVGFIYRPIIGGNYWTRII